jgi:hypothetical protein
VSHTKMLVSRLASRSRIVFPARAVAFNTGRYPFTANFATSASAMACSIYSTYTWFH